MGTLEIYSISTCDQYSSGKTHFTDMVLTSASGEVLTPQWTQPRGTECQGKLDVLSPSAIDIYHNGGGGPTGFGCVKKISVNASESSPGSCYEKIVDGHAQCHGRCSVSGYHCANGPTGCGCVKKISVNASIVVV